MNAMDTKFGRIYCAISKYNFFYIFNSKLPEIFIDRNETYAILNT